MKKGKGKKKTKRRSTSRRIQSDKLQKRIKKGIDKQQSGNRKSVIKGDYEGPRWNPGDGDHIFDCIPYLAGRYDNTIEEGDPTYTCEIWVHPNLGPDNEVRLCMSKMYGEPCAVCEDRQSQIERGKDKEVWKKLFPKCRQLYNVVSYDKGEEKKGVQVWDISNFYSEKHILSIAKRPVRGRKGKKGGTKTINFSDPVNGKSIVFKIEPAVSKDDYPSYVGWSFEDRDYEIDDDILDGAHTLDEIIHRPSYDEVADLYYGKGGKGKKRRADDEEGVDWEEVIEEVEDAEEMDELKDIVKEYDIDIKLKKKKGVEWNAEKITSWISEQNDEEEEEEGESEYTEEDIEDMDEEELEELIEDEDLDIDADDYDDLEELQEAVIEEMDL